VRQLGEHESAPSLVSGRGRAPRRPSFAYQRKRNTRRNDHAIC
jgi:hypothetical protein